MLKATGGGGGIGMRAVHDAEGLADAWERVQRVAAASFSSAGVFLERLVEHARHVEVQVFGDGEGRVITFGDRDCSLQRRNQKVLEEAPAPGLPAAVRRRLTSSARELCASVGYRSAGTVEFVYDAAREEAYFLEVNTRLQVEHPVTEEIYGVDLVEWMLRLAQGETAVVREPGEPRGHAVEARVYAEDPSRDHRPGAGLLTRVSFPTDVRVDSWVETGTEVTTAYDPMLAKVVAYGADRAEAFDRLDSALAATRVDGIETNLGLVRAALADASVRAAAHTTATLATISDPTPRIEVMTPGTLTTVQDWPGRTGYWQVGVPPSGPMDDRSFRLGNRALGNDEGAPGLECTLQGPTLRFTHATTVCVAGAPAPVTVDGAPVRQWEPFTVPAGSSLAVGTPDGHGLRTCILFAGGLDVPDFLGSAATFTLGRFGGHGGRALRTGDVLHGGTAAAFGTPVPHADRPAYPNIWHIAVTEGPHAAPEFFTEEDIHDFYAAGWKVHFNSARTGVRLIGPKPRWARTDGGEAGLHPSNIHDTPYSVGAVDYTGDMPVLLGPDGPSLGGFVCPATILKAERWKLGQLRPGDTVRFVPVTVEGEEREAIVDGGILGQGESVTYRRSGDDNLLVEYGEMQLDLALRMRVHALAEAVAAEGLPGVVDLTPGIRSLQIQIDPETLSQAALLSVLTRLESELPPADALVVPSRTVHLPCPGTTRRHGRRSPAIRPGYVTTRHGARGTSSSSAASTASIRWTTSTARSSTRNISYSAWATSTWGRRSPRRWTRATGWSPRSTTRPGPGRRRTRSESAARICASTAWRGRAAISSWAVRLRCGRAGRNSRGCCASSTGSSGTRSTRTNSSNSARTWRRAVSRPVSRRERSRWPSTGDSSTRTRSRSRPSGPASRGRSGRSATRGRRLASSPARTRRRRRGRRRLPSRNWTSRRAAGWWRPNSQPRSGS